MLALWMTNRERHWRFVEAELLPHWGVRPAAAWLWLKLSDAGIPATPLVSSCRHQSQMAVRCWHC